MGSDGFESKKHGASVPGGSSPNLLGGEFSGGAARDTTIDALAGLGENLVEISGVIKWFDASKGYGFISPDEGDKDLFVHHSNIAGEGFKSLTEGAKVSYEEENGDKGPKAVNVTKI